MVSLALLLAGLTAHAANPVPVISENTQTSALISWAPVPNITSYRIDELHTDNYRQAWTTTYSDYTDLSLFVDLSAAICRSFRVYANQPVVQTPPIVLVCPLSPPGVSSVVCKKVISGLARLSYRQFYPGYPYTCLFSIAGNPKPVVTLIESPAGMVTSSYVTLTWIGYEATHVTLHLVNSEGVVDFGYDLTPR
jgi:hypothetical protein